MNSTITAPELSYSAVVDANDGEMCGLFELLSIRGQPYTLDDFFPLKPIFNRYPAKSTLLKCGRKVAKTTTLCADAILRAACTPYLHQTFVLPRETQAHRVSNDYLSPFLNSDTIVGKTMVDSSCDKAVSKRSLTNRAKIEFTFAYLDCERTRSLATDVLRYDEVQDLDWSFPAVIDRSMDASPYGGYVFHSGTAKSLDNIIQALWDDSSRGEWVTPCSCGYKNVATIEVDLMKMIGKAGLSCAKCEKVINSRLGFWTHQEPKKFGYRGLHIPQPIMPMHCERPDKWRELLDKKEGRDSQMTEAMFINEVLGESVDSGVKLVTITDIRMASRGLGPNSLEAAAEALRHYEHSALAVDWSGGGKDQVSHTAVTVAGLDPITGVVRAPYVDRFPFGMTPLEEIVRLLHIWKLCRPKLFAHDYGGTGGVREALMIQNGFPINQIMGILYVRAPSRDMVYYEPPAPGSSRGYHAVDKAKSLVFQATAIKQGYVRLPDYNTSKHVTHDLLGLVEEKRESAGGADVYLIRKVPKIPDDFAHSLNYACLACWHRAGRYPLVTQPAKDYDESKLD